MRKLKYVKLFENFQVNEATYVKGIGMDLNGLGTIYRFSNVGQTTETSTGDVGSLYTAKQMGFYDMEYVDTLLNAIKGDQKKLIVMNILFPNGLNKKKNEPLLDNEKNDYCFFFTQFDGDYTKELDKLVDPFNLNSIGGKNGVWVSKSLKSKESEIIKKVENWEKFWHYNHYGREKE